MRLARLPVCIPMPKCQSCDPLPEAGIARQCGDGACADKQQHDNHPQRLLIVPLQVKKTPRKDGPDCRSHNKRAVADGVEAPVRPHPEIARCEEGNHVNFRTQRQANQGGC